MPTLASMTRAELTALLKFLEPQFNPMMHDDESMRTYVAGRFGEATIKSAMRALKSKVTFTPDASDNNAAALGEKVAEAPKTVGQLAQALAAANAANKSKSAPFAPGPADPGFPSATDLGKLLRSEREFILGKLNLASKQIHEAAVQDAGLATVAGLEALQKHLNERIDGLVLDSGAPAPIVHTHITIEQQGDTPSFTLSGTHFHPAFQKCLRLLRAGLNVLMVGPAGSGKTTLAEQLAEALGVPYYFQSLTAGTPESALTVKLQPLGAGGAMRCVASPFLCGFAGRENILVDGQVTIASNPKRAGLTLLDEVDGMDANTGLVLNSALANNKMTIEALAAMGSETVVSKSPHNYIIASANTFGTGMDLQYAGRNALDAAFLDRFYVVKLDYDPTLEASIAGLPAPSIPKWMAVSPPSEAEWRALGRWIIETRGEIEKRGLKKVWGTRMLLKAKAARYAGIPTAEVKSDLLLGWPPDIRKALLEKTY